MRILRLSSPLLFAGIALLSSCKKEDTPDPAGPSNDKPAVVSVLRDNSGWQQKVAFVRGKTQGINNLSAETRIRDFSIDPNNVLHLLTVEGVLLQQGSNDWNKLAAYNILNNEEVKADSLYNLGQFNSIWNETFGFFPYSGKVECFSASDVPNSYRFARWTGYKPYDGAELPWLTGEPFIGGWGYYNLHCQHPNYDSAWAIIDLAPPSNIMMVVPLKTASMNRFNRVGLFVEPRYSGSQRSSYIVNVRKDSVIAHRIYPVITDVNKTYPVIAAISTKNTFPANGNYELRRHFNATGEVMSMMIYEKNSNRYWTYSLDMKNNSLSANLDNADLPYSDQGSDIDMDEQGNIYYTGLAGNGSNQNGVSVYKRTPSGTTLVGTDDFIKSGIASCLKYYQGKPWVGIVANFKPSSDPSHIQWVELAFVTPK